MTTVLQQLNGWIYQNQYLVTLVVVIVLLVLLNKYLSTKADRKDNEK
jgi:membrane protein implicated in regulation of membrane protease activity